MTTRASGTRTCGSEPDAPRRPMGKTSTSILPTGAFVRLARSLVGIAVVLCCQPGFAFGQGLEVKKQGTKLAYITHDGKPLLSFGCHLEHMFLRDYSPDYRVWSTWAQAHGINHCRIRVCQPKTGDTYKPYQPAGGGKYDLTKFHPAFWSRFRAICKNLSDHGIFMHFLVFPHNQHVRSSNWGESLFNPANNVNSATNHLSGNNFYKFWHSVADNQTGLWNLQAALLKKMLEETADLENIYFDLSHEFRTDCCGAQPTDWSKARKFFSAVADEIRMKYAELKPGKTPLIGLDAEHFAKAGQQGWNFGNPAFDLMILGNSSSSPIPSVDTVISWRETYKKPFLLQEGGADDDSGGKIYISYKSTNRAILRKYVWKWMVAKNQFIEIYQKGPGPSYPANYNPNGHNGFEDDAKVLRQFWDSLTDYGNLDYVGSISSGPGFRKMVLSSSKEAIAYMASRMGQVGTGYSARSLSLTGLALADGTYTVSIWKPVASGGLVQTLTETVQGGSITVSLPSFTDDLVVHLVKESTGPGNQPPSVSITNPADGAMTPEPADIRIDATASDSDGTVARVEFYQGATMLGQDTTEPYSYTWNNVGAGTYTLTAQATDSQGATTTSAAVTITVTPGSSPTPPSISGPSSPLPSGTEGSSYSATFTATGSSPITWSRSAGAMVPGVSLDSSTGVFSGTPTAAGTYTFTIEAANSAGSDSRVYTLTIDPPGGGGDPFQQDPGAQGIVSIEAENYHDTLGQAGHSWVFVASPAGYSGSGAMESNPNSGAKIDTGFAAGSPRLDYQVNFTRAGTHYVWVRGAGASGADDSAHVGLDGAEIATSDRMWGFGTGWTWSADTMDGTVATFDVPSAGVHTVNVWMREDGFDFDKLVLTTDPGYVPTGTGPAESPSGGGGIAPIGSGSSGGGCGATGMEALLLALILGRRRRKGTP